jgi:hypothetical protein
MRGWVRGGKNGRRHDKASVAVLGPFSHNSLTKSTIWVHFPQISGVSLPSLCLISSLLSGKIGKAGKDSSFVQPQARWACGY